MLYPHAMTLLSIALALTVTTYENPGQLADRVQVITEATEIVSRDHEEEAALLVIAYGESRFDPFVHAGLPHPRWSQGHGRAKGL